jgi:arylsulfatase A-like enzyme
VLAIVIMLVGCRQAAVSRPPSILLFVLDTTRVDAVSVYGRIGGTTPAADALASDGLRYTRAYAQAPWTLPSHATLFTGLLPSQHGVGWHHPRAPDSLVMLAERLRDAGYETVGVSENAWITDTFNMTQGFERFTSPRKLGDVPDVREAVAGWIRERDRARPYFLFVNVTDSHAPYSVRARNPFLPLGVTPAAAEAVSQDPRRYFCAKEPHEAELAVLWGLYLGDVAAADAKLREVLQALRDAGLTRDLVTVVTADHGEHFGEHGLVGHQFSVREPLLHVPLIVHGLAGIEPSVIDAPVQLADLVPTILGWAGLPLPPELVGHPLPTAVGTSAAAAPIVGEQLDFEEEPESETPSLARYLRRWTDRLRGSCTSDDRVFGDIRALVRYPFKLVWYARYPAQLYDLSSDGNEEHDIAPAKPALAQELTADMLRRVTAVPRAAPEPPSLPPPPEVLDRLRALGYLGEEHAPALPSGERSGSK